MVAGIRSWRTLNSAWVGRARAEVTQATTKKTERRENIVTEFREWVRLVKSSNNKQEAMEVMPMDGNKIVTSNLLNTLCSHLFCLGRSSYIHSSDMHQTTKILFGEEA